MIRLRAGTVVEVHLSRNVTELVVLERDLILPARRLRGWERFRLATRAIRQTNAAVEAMAEVFSLVSRAKHSA